MSGDTTGDCHEPTQGADRGLLDVLMPTFSGNKDEYAREAVPAVPLTFYQVSEGRLPSSRTPFLQLPFEILAQIIQDISSDSLASLALVNSDCRYLARSRQFVSLRFDCSVATLGLVGALLAEAEDRLDSGHTKKAAIGPCIRRITVSTHPGWVALRHQVELSEEFTKLPKAERDARLKAGSEAFFGVYLPSIRKLISDQQTLPHLELFDIEDNVTLDPAFFDDLTKSCITHFKLDHCSVDRPFSIKAPKTKDIKHLWPLKSLSMSITPQIHALETDVSPLCVSLLHSCASTLESLTWCDRMDSSIHSHGLGPHPSFPQLCALRLSFVTLEDDAILRELVHDKLQRLEAGLCSSKAMATFFDRRGRIPSLKVFIWNDGRIKETRHLSFLKANRQLETLAIPYGAEPTLINDQILPLLTTSFQALKSLSLVYHDDGISHAARRTILDEGLKSICQIITLEQLHLSLGHQFGWSHTWLVNHNKMRSTLCALSRLKGLVFSRDSYSNAFSQNCDIYYDLGYMRFQHCTRGAASAKEKFEKAHRKKTVKRANKYVEKMPHLEWLYFGQLPMQVRKKRAKGKKRAVVVSAERDDCSTWIRETFGWKGMLPT